jgi:hypothetical protein
MIIESKNNTTEKSHSSKLFLPLNVVNINEDGFALGVISLVSNNGCMT